jgi:chitodextrinase
VKLELDPADVQALLQEAGEPTTFAIRQEDGGLLVRVGGITLGQPAEVDGKLVFDHNFSADAIALLKSRAATRKAVIGNTLPVDLEDTEFAAWRSGLNLMVGDVLRYGTDESAVVYEVIQAHTSQADWPPPTVPALFKLLREDTGSEPSVWLAGGSYSVGERVTYGGSVYECLQAHTSQVGWEPSAVPALWSLVL